MVLPAVIRVEAGLSITENGEVVTIVGVTVRVALWLLPEAAAVMLTLVDTVTVPAVAVKVVFVLPEGTVTLAGTVATAVLPLVSVTTVPPVGAAPLNVTVPVEVAPEVTDVGFNVTDDTETGGVTVSTALWLLPEAAAVIVTAVDVATVRVVTVKVVLVLPAGTVTLAGTVAAEVLPLVSVTTVPPVGAAPFKVTVPVEDVPEVTDVGFNVTDDTETGGVTVSTALWLLPEAAAVIVTAVDVATVRVVTVKVVLVLPAGTVTLAGTVAAEVLPLVSVTTVPPVGAAPFKVTVPVEDVPEVTDVGFNVTDDTAGVVLNDCTTTFSTFIT